MTTIYVKNMHCDCCVNLLKLLLKQEKYPATYIKKGLINIETNNKTIIANLISFLNKNGFPVIENKELILLEQIKQAVNELVMNMNNANSIVRRSDYLIEKTGYSYQYLSRIFSKYENQTLEKYIITLKIEKVKELLRTDEYTLSEIAYMMDYSSVQYLSAQFKKITGISVTEFRAKYQPPI